ARRLCNLPLERARVRNAERGASNGRVCVDEVGSVMRHPEADMRVPRGRREECQTLAEAHVCGVVGRRHFDDAGERRIDKCARYVLCVYATVVDRDYTAGGALRDQRLANRAAYIRKLHTPIV